MMMGLMPLVVAMVVGCGGKAADQTTIPPHTHPHTGSPGDDDDDSTTTDTSTVPTTGDTGTLTGACPWVGTWEITEANCGSFPYDDWFDTYEVTKMTISEELGGCFVQFRWEGDTCQETEKWHLLPIGGDDLSVVKDGIQTCQPEECTFGPGDNPCEVGGRAGTRDVIVDDTTGDLQFVGLLQFGAPACVLDLVTTWELQP